MKKQPTPKKREIEKQKDAIEELVLKGFKFDQIAEMLSISRATVERRVAERRKENLADYKVLDEQKRMERVSEMMAKYRLMERKLWSVHAEASDSRSKIAAIMAVLDVDKHAIQIQQILGFLPQDGTNFNDGKQIIVEFNIPRPDRSKQLNRQQD